MEPFKVICLDSTDFEHRLTIGKEYTCITRMPSFTGIDDKLYFSDISGGWKAFRFRELEKMQDTNFIELVGKENNQCK